MEGHVSDRLQNVSDRLLLIDYLVNELMAARILQEKKPEKKIQLKIVSNVLNLHEIEGASYFLFNILFHFIKL